MPKVPEMRPPVNRQFNLGESFGNDEFQVIELVPGNIWPLNRNVVVETLSTTSWDSKFVPDHLTSEEVRAKIVPGSQGRKIDDPQNSARYLLAGRIVTPQRAYMTSLEYEAVDVQGAFMHRRTLDAVLRIEEYQPRNPFKRSYPNITALETVTGKLDGLQDKQAAALLYLALDAYELDRKVSAYGEDVNPDGLAWYQDVGFTETGNRPTEVIGDHEITYVHMEASSIGGVRQLLADKYRPWLKQQSGTKRTTLHEWDGFRA
jgi:hypothetical protein